MAENGRIFWNFAEWKGPIVTWKFYQYFFEKKIHWGNLIFLALRPFFTVWLGMVKSSQATVNWIVKQDMIRICKQWRHDFSGKHLCDGYCMDTVWCLYGGQISWFCKASLRICYVSLFECKHPWMLKTFINWHVWNRGLQN